MPGVERTRTPIVPPTSVSSRSATSNSLVRSMPGRKASPSPRSYSPWAASGTPPSGSLVLPSSATGSDHPQSARDPESLPGDEGRVVGGQERHRGRDLVHLAKPAHLGRRLHRLDDPLTHLAQRSRRVQE